MARGEYSCPKIRLETVRLFGGADLIGGELGDVVEDEGIALYSDTAWPCNARAWRPWLAKGSASCTDSLHTCIIAMIRGWTWVARSLAMLRECWPDSKGLSDLQ